MKQYKFDNKIHAHTLDGQPLIGTSAVASVLAKPLTWWASGLAVREFGCPDAKVLTKRKKAQASDEELNTLYATARKMQLNINGLTIEQYVNLLDKAYRAHTTTLNEKAAEGTDLHAECERYVKDQMSSTSNTQTYHPRILPFIEWSKKRVKRFLWSEANCYSEKYWIGGISDCGFEDIEGKIGILDFKSSKEAYLSQFWQCAGYDIQITENGCLDSKGKQTYALEKPIKYYMILPFGMEKPIPQINFNPGVCKEMFLHELAIYKALPHD